MSNQLQIIPWALNNFQLDAPAAFDPNLAIDHTPSMTANGNQSVSNARLVGIQRVFSAAGIIGFGFGVVTNDPLAAVTVMAVGHAGVYETGTFESPSGSAARLGRNSVASAIGAGIALGVTAVTNWKMGIDLAEAILVAGHAVNRLQSSRDAREASRQLDNDSVGIA